jgi:hypothetical protein
MQSPSASFICEGNWRKAINLFLRDALYNVYLARAALVVAAKRGLTRVHLDA